MRKSSSSSGGPGQVFGVGGRVESDLGQEAGSVGEAGGQPLELLQVHEAGAGVVVETLEKRRVEESDPL